MQAEIKDGYVSPFLRYKQGDVDVHYYTSLAEFLPLITRENLLAAFKGSSWRQEAKKFDHDAGDLEWAGGMTCKDAVKRAAEGETITPEILEIRDRINSEVKKTIADTFTWDVTGEQVDVGSFLEGVPECMMTTSQDQTRNKKVVTIVYNASVSCVIEPRIMRLRGLAMLAFVDALEATKRYRVNLYYAVASNFNYAGGASGALVIRLQDPSHRYDPQAIGFALTQPAMFRRCVFAYWNLLSDADARRWGVSNYGYGHCCTLRRLPKEIDDTEVFGTNEHMVFETASLPMNTEKDAIRWIESQMQRLTVDSAL